MAGPATPTQRQIMLSCAFTLSAVSAGVMIYGLVHDDLRANMLINALFVATAFTWLLWTIVSLSGSFAERLDQVEREIRSDVFVMSRNGIASRNGTRPKAN